MIMKTRIRALYFFLLIFLSAILGFYPITNGDIPFYIASILSKQGVTDTQLWEQTKSVLAAEFPTRLFEFHAYNLDHADQGIMKFYHIKPLYGWIIYGIHQLGFSYSFSILLPSLVAFFLMGMIVFHWAGTKLNPIQTMGFSLLFMLMGPILIIARMSSPDALSSLVLFTAFASLYLEKGRLSVFLFLLLSVLVRMDNIVTVMVILTGMLFWPDRGSSNKIPVSTYILTMVFSILLTAGLNALLQEHFWWILDASYFASAPSYFEQWKVFIAEFCSSFLFLLIIVLAIIHIGRRINFREKNYWILLIIAGIVLVRSVVFPSLEERFFPAFYLTMLLIMVDIVTGQNHNSFPSNQ